MVEVTAESFGVQLPSSTRRAGTQSSRRLAVSLTSLPGILKPDLLLPAMRVTFLAAL
jgi:hypothetical protein